MQDEDLSRTRAAGTDADRRHGEPAAEFGCQCLGNRFQDQQPGASLLLRQRVGE
ncbi:MAG: hypothetical protein AW07_03040 [Candidatus Accumulibacter sp. SK-11]|nr:MAG: hypothetical protein AW07_03040 [Candidatus Accumulibacter sp. SK-11]